MAYLFIFFAAVCAASVNFCLRKNLESQKSAAGYLALYFIFSFLVSLLLRSEFDWASFSWTLCSTGILAGSLNLLMMFLMAKALKVGPSSLTFAFQNSASVFPALLLFLLFGSQFGFHLNAFLILGSLCLVAGLFLSIRKDFKTTSSKTWLLLALTIFLLQGTILSIFQWRVLLQQYPAESHFLIPFSCSPREDEWFMPGFFWIPALAQTLIFFSVEKRWFSKKELFLGTVGGAFNAGSTFCLLLATKIADDHSRSLLFPLFAILVIFLCNLWGKRLYKEPIDWKGTALCLGGVLIAAWR
ncbi:MAG: hypothetical protein JSS32_03505 [Verrucomicrobia bacterium]|nr:hypothetical protein [Verrucomicrobiota bacterium]